MLFSEYPNCAVLREYRSGSNYFDNKLKFKDWASANGLPTVPILARGAGYVVRRRGDFTTEPVFTTTDDSYIERMVHGIHVKFWVFRERPVIVQTMEFETSRTHNYNWITEDFRICPVDMRFKSGPPVIPGDVIMALAEKSRTVSENVPVPFVQVDWVLTCRQEKFLTSISTFPRIITTSNFNPRLNIVLGRLLGIGENDV